MDSKRLKTRTAIVAMAATAIVLFGGFAIPSVYAQGTQVKSEFESSLTPLCSPEEVFFSGTMHLVLGPNDVNGRQTGYVNYINTKGVGAQTGTQFTVHEIDHITIVTNENGDIIFTTTQHGSFVSRGGAGDNTKVTLKLVTILHPNGDVDTIVDDVDVKCLG